MMLVLSVVLGLVPLAGIAWTVRERNDHHRGWPVHEHHPAGLSGILFLNVYLEARKKFTLKKAPQAQKSS